MSRSERPWPPGDNGVAARCLPRWRPYPYQKRFHWLILFCSSTGQIGWCHSRVEACGWCVIWRAVPVDFQSKLCFLYMEVQKHEIRVTLVWECFVFGDLLCRSKGRTDHRSRDPKKARQNASFGADTACDDLKSQFIFNLRSV